MHVITTTECQNIGAGITGLEIAGAFVAGATVFTTLSLLAPSDDLTAKNAAIHGTAQATGTIVSMWLVGLLAQ